MKGRAVLCAVMAALGIVTSQIAKATAPPPSLVWQVMGMTNANDIAFSRDGSLVAASVGPYVQLVDTQTGLARWVIVAGLTGNAKSIAISPDNQWVAFHTFYDPAELIIVRASNGEEVLRQSSGSWVNQRELHFSSDSKHLFGATVDDQVVEFMYDAGFWARAPRTWDLSSLNQTTSFTVLQNGPYFATTHLNSDQLHVWDRRTVQSQPVRSLEIQSQGRIDSDVTAGTDRFVTRSNELRIVTLAGDPTAWTVQDVNLPLGHDLEPRAAMFGSMLSDEGQLIYTILEQQSPRRQVLAAFTHTGTIELSQVAPGLSTSSGAPIFRAGADRVGWFAGTIINTAPRNHVLVTALRSNYADTRVLHGPTSEGRAVVSSNGLHAAVADTSTVMSWNPTTSRMRWLAPIGTGGFFVDVAVANDGSIAYAGRDRLHFLSPTGQAIGSQPGETGLLSVSPVPFGALGYVVAMVGPTTVPLFRMSTGGGARSPLALPAGDTPTRLAFSPNGALLGVTGGRGFYVYRTSDWAVVAQTTSFANERFAWHPDSQQILFPGWPNKKLVRMVGSGFIEVMSFINHPIGSFAWAPDGRTLLAWEGGQDNLETYRTVAPTMPFQKFPLPGFRGSQAPAAFTPDAKHFWYVTSAGLLRVMTNPFAVSPPTSLTLTPTRLRQVGSTSTVRVQIEGVAPMGGTPVSLQSGNSLITVSPASVTIPQGQNVATFTARVARGATALNSVGLTARNAGGSRSATLTVEPLAAPAPLRITPASSTMRGPGTTMAVTVSLRTPAFLGGDAVTLTSSSPSVLSVVAPTTVTVPAGQASARFTVRLNRAVAANTPITLTATTTGGTARTTITVLPELPPRPVSVVPNPSSLLGIGVQSVVRVTLAAPAPLGGAAVTLTTSAPSLLGVVAPTTLTVPAGRTTVDFRVRTLTRPAATTVVTLTARTATGAATGRITVRR